MIKILKRNSCTCGWDTQIQESKGHPGGHVQQEVFELSVVCLKFSTLTHLKGPDYLAFHLPVLLHQVDSTGYCCLYHMS